MAGPRASQAPEAGFCARFDRRMRMQQQYLPLLIRTCGLENLALNTAAMGTEVVQLLLSCLSPVGAPCSLGSRHPGCHGVCGGGRRGSAGLRYTSQHLSTGPGRFQSPLPLSAMFTSQMSSDFVFSPPSSLGSNIITSERTSLAALFKTAVSSLDSLRPFLLLPSTNHRSTRCRHYLEYAPNLERGLPSGAFISVWPECGLACSGASRNTR